MDIMITPPSHQTVNVFGTKENSSDIPGRLLFFPI